MAFRLGKTVTFAFGNCLLPFVAAIQLLVCNPSNDVSFSMSLTLKVLFTTSWKSFLTRNLSDPAHAYLAFHGRKE